MEIAYGGRVRLRGSFLGGFSWNEGKMGDIKEKKIPEKGVEEDRVRIGSAIESYFV